MSSDDCMTRQQPKVAESITTAIIGKEQRHHQSKQLHRGKGPENLEEMVTLLHSPTPHST